METWKNTQSFKADLKQSIEGRYNKRDLVTFLRACLQGKPLDLIKGMGTDYDAAWEYSDSIYGDNTRYRKVPRTAKRRKR